MKFLFKINKFLPSFKRKSNLLRFQNILVVSNTGLGDTILSTPAIRSLRESFPDINITFLISKKMFPLFQGFEYVDDFEIYKSGFFNQIRTVIKLRQRNIDTIFLFHSNGPEDVFFSILSGAVNIFKMTDNINHQFKKCFSNEPNSTCQHDIEKKLDLVKIFKPKVIYKKLLIPGYFKEEFGFFEKDNNLIYIGFQLGAQDKYKIWPTANFVQLALKLYKESSKLRFVLLGSTKNEIKIADEFCLTFGKENAVINLCGKSFINELPKIINDLELLVSNDTGTLHLAIAQGIKTVSLFGPTNPDEFGPYQDYNIHKVVNTGNPEFVKDRQNNFKNLNNISKINIERVFSSVKELL